MSLDFVEKCRLPLIAIALVFVSYIWLVFPLLAAVISQLGVTLGTLGAASYRLSDLFYGSWPVTLLFLGLVFVAEILTSSRGLRALLNCALTLVLLFMMAGVALGTLFH